MLLIFQFLQNSELLLDFQQKGFWLILEEQQSVTARTVPCDQANRHMRDGENVFTNLFFLPPHPPPPPPQHMPPPPPPPPKKELSMGITIARMKKNMAADPETSKKNLVNALYPGSNHFSVDCTTGDSPYSAPRTDRRLFTSHS
ncbi:hypothetical protein TELCIR_02295 [Teladorsagia circumcincta]|uniref:Uncharacterized protein n=1 Tax=Teladorsagia circumcincta TaxID=45464 RepID=A0A2G9UZI5_TELCI|nr:hypothetical protein TELCIR_02295 [Teladorsagia circumcincta]